MLPVWNGPERARGQRGVLAFLRRRPAALKLEPPLPRTGPLVGGNPVAKGDAFQHRLAEHSRLTHSREVGAEC